ncbi:MAG: hypothetical protein EU547_06385 [Promethearchaeota archaeon]|nr:MAG: hypothetical protein EU547_06385 [Candidatus Lokiarchaeota archaeon]
MKVEELARKTIRCQFCGAIVPNKNTCPACGAKLRCDCGELYGTSAKFCRNCGKKVPSPFEEKQEPKYMKCPACGEKMEINIAFCTSCGTYLVKHRRKKELGIPYREAIKCQYCESENITSSFIKYYTEKTWIKYICIDCKEKGELNLRPSDSELFIKDLSTLFFRCTSCGDRVIVWNYRIEMLFTLKLECWCPEERKKEYKEIWSLSKSELKKFYERIFEINNVLFEIEVNQKLEAEKLKNHELMDLGSGDLDLKNKK